jgi:hypothetical protein
MGWIFREQNRDDYGIDAHIEITRDGRATGRLIAAQIKSGRSYLRETLPGGKGYVYRGQIKHLLYWQHHSLPVILILCDPDNEQCYYSEVGGGLTEPSGRGWKIAVSSTQVLGVRAAPHLLQLAWRPQHRDIVQRLLLEHLVEKYDRRLAIASVIDMPRDFHRFPYVVDVYGEGLYGVQFIYSGDGAISLSRIQEEIEWRQSNDSATAGGVTELLLFLVGDEVEDTKLPPDAEQVLARDGHVKWCRMLYQRPGVGGTPSYSELNEISDRSEVTDQWLERGSALDLRFRNEVLPVWRSGREREDGAY